MKRRMLDGGIWANEKFAELPGMARLLQIGLVTLADDQGRMKAHPAYLRSQLFPYDDVAVSDVSEWLELIMANGTIIVYEVGGKDYIQLINWWDYQSLQYASPSEHPRPDGWQDRIRYNAKGNMTLTCNWITVGGDTLTDTCDQHGNPLPIVATLPPRNPGGRPPKNQPENPPENPGGNPPENVNKEQIKINTGEGESAREAAPKTPPPQKTRKELTQQRANRLRAGEFAGCDPALLTQLTNHVKRIYGYEVLIDSPGDDKLEDKMRREAYRLWELGFTDDQAIDVLDEGWRQFSAGFKIKRPQGDQLYELAVNLRSRAGDVPTPVNGFSRGKFVVERMEGEDW